MAGLGTTGDTPFMALESSGVAFQIIIGARQPDDVIAVKQAWPIALRDVLDMLEESLGWLTQVLVSGQAMQIVL